MTRRALVVRWTNVFHLHLLLASEWPEDLADYRTLSHCHCETREPRANDCILTPLQQCMSTGEIPFSSDRRTHNPCHPSAVFSVTPSSNPVSRFSRKRPERERVEEMFIAELT